MKKKVCSRKQNSKDEFRRSVLIGENGENLYHAPLKADEICLQDFGATKKDVVMLRFYGRVLFCRVINKNVAEYLWNQLVQEHNKEVMESRCMVPAKNGGWIICSRSNSCRPELCPYKKKADEKKRNTVSLDYLVSHGYEPETDMCADEQAIRNVEIEQLKALMDAEDPRIWMVFKMREEYGMPADNVAEVLGISVPRVYQLLARGREIGAQFRKNNN